MKTIGVLGGLGPQATMDFEARLHQVAQRLIPPHGNSGYPPLVVYYHRRPPFVMSADGRTPVFPRQPDRDLLQAAQWLGMRADFLVISANAPHVFQDQIEQAAGRKVLSMIDATLEEVQRRGWRKIGVLVFGDPLASIYTRPLSQLNLAYELIEEGLCARLDEAILDMQAGQNDAESTAVAREAIAALRASRVDGIILGCTEIPLLLHEDANESDLINPLQLLADAAVRYALAEA